MVASRISRYVANLTPREYEYERELYYNCEPYADLEDWSVLLNEAIEAQLRGRPPRPLFHPGQEEAFVTAYGHLDDRAQGKSFQEKT